MELFSDWDQKDYLVFLVSVLSVMGLAFLVSMLYNQEQIRRLKRLEIPLK